MPNRYWRTSYVAAAAGVVLAVLALANSVPVHSAATLIPGLVAWYTFDGHSGDMSGNEHHGTVGDGTLVADRHGRKNSALYFDGKNDFATFPVNINPSVMPHLTITFWVYSDGAQADYVHVLSHDSGGYGRSIALSDRAKKRQWAAYSGNTKRVEATPRVLSNSWVFIAVAYNQTEGSVIFWVDGERYAGQGKLPGGYGELRAAINVHNMNFFRGAIDDLRIYNRALNPGEISQIRTE